MLKSPHLKGVFIDWRAAGPEICSMTGLEDCLWYSCLCQYLLWDKEFGTMGKPVLQGVLVRMLINVVCSCRWFALCFYYEGERRQA